MLTFFTHVFHLQYILLSTDSEMFAYRVAAHAGAHFSELWCCYGHIQVLSLILRCYQKSACCVKQWQNKLKKQKIDNEKYERW